MVFIDMMDAFCSQRMCVCYGIYPLFSIKCKTICPFKSGIDESLKIIKDIICWKILI